MSIFEMMDAEWGTDKMSAQDQMLNILALMKEINKEVNRKGRFGQMSRATRAVNGLYFTYKDVDRMVVLYEQLGGMCEQINEGFLQSGNWVLYDAPEWPTIIIREEVVNCWQTGQTIEAFEPDEVPEQYTWMMAKA